MSRLNRNQKRRKKYKKRRYRDERWLARAEKHGITFVTSARRMKMLYGTPLRPIEVPSTSIFKDCAHVFEDIWVVPEKQHPSVPVPEEHRGKGFLLARIPVEGDLNSVNVTFDDDMKVVVEGLPAALGVPKEYLFPSENLNEQQARAQMNYYRMTQGLGPLPEKESGEVFPDDVFAVVEQKDETKTLELEPLKYPEGGVFHFDAKGVKVLEMGPDTKLRLGEKIHELAQRDGLPVLDDMTVTRGPSKLAGALTEWMTGVDLAVGKSYPVSARYDSEGKLLGTSLVDTHDVEGNPDVTVEEVGILIPKDEDDG